MPIAFPQPNPATVLEDIKRLSTKPFFVVPAPSMQAPNKLYSPYIADPGKAQKALMAPIRDIGRNYRDPARTSTVNPIVNPTALPVSIGSDFNRILGVLNMTLSGVSRDAAGARLANCQVLIFRTQDKSLVAETTSDSNGDWSVSLLKGGPFFLVEYKAGAPDVFGSSSNTLVPT